MAPGKQPPTGLQTATQAVLLGRAAFFGSSENDLPKGRSSQIAANDLIPQFGFVGESYLSTRVLLLGINPGNGSDTVESTTDARMLPLFRAFASAPSPESFREAQREYRAACESWAIWDNHCRAVLSALGLSAGGIAYANCLPWRTASKSDFARSVCLQTARLYVAPLVRELAPNIIVAMGKKAFDLLTMAQVAAEQVVCWNRAQALTAAVAADRQAALEQLRAIAASFQQRG